MSRPRLIVAAGLAFGFAISLAVPAAAQSAALQTDERAYCNSLAGTYARYMPTRAYGGSMGASPSVQTMVALEMCNNGRAAEAIPQLEKALLGAGFGVSPPAVGTRLP